VYDVGRHRNWSRQSRYPGDRGSPYLANSGTLEKVATTANHASTRATQLYDRRRDELSLDVAEWIVIRVRVFE
jgi:hypothetical protein